MALSMTPATREMRPSPIRHSGTRGGRNPTPSAMRWPHRWTSCSRNRTRWALKRTVGVCASSYPEWVTLPRVRELDERLRLLGTTV